LRTANKNIATLVNTIKDILAMPFLEAEIISNHHKLKRE
jgi:hypothetical protein